MKNLKNNKLIIGLLAVGIISGIGLTYWFTFHSHPQKVKTDSKISQKKIGDKNKDVGTVTGLSPEQINKLTDKQKEQYIDGQGKLYLEKKFKINNKNNTEFPDGQNDSLIKQYLEYASFADYNKIIEDMKPKVAKYNFTVGTNLKIAGIYHDASLMVTSLTVPREQAGKIAKGMVEPDMMVIGTMMLPELSRRSIITDKDSLSPIFKGNVKIIKTEVLNGDTKDLKGKIVFGSCTGAKDIYKITFEIEKNTLIAYVAEFDDATLEFFGVYAPEGKEYHYQNIKFWEQQDANTQKHFDLQ